MTCYVSSGTLNSTNSTQLNLPSHRASTPDALLPVSIQIILLGDRGTCVWTTCPGSLYESGMAGTQTPVANKSNAPTITQSCHTSRFRLKNNKALITQLLNINFNQSFQIHFFSPNSPKPPISDDIDGISKHRLSPITPTLKHDNTQRFPV